MPRARDDASQNALPCSYWRSLRSMPISLSSRRRSPVRSCAAALERLAQPRQVGQQLGADGVHHVLGVALEHRHEGLHAVEHRPALGADHEGGEAALAHASRAAPRRSPSPAMPPSSRPGSTSSAAVSSRTSPARCGRSHGTPPNCSAWVVSCSATQRSSSSGSASSVRAGVGEVRRDEEQARGRVAGRGRGTRTGPSTRPARKPGDRAGLDGRAPRRRPHRPGPDSAPIRPVDLVGRRVEHAAQAAEVRVGSTRGRSTASGAGSAPAGRSPCRRRRGARSPPRAVRARGTAPGPRRAAAPPRPPPPCLPAASRP